MAKYILISCEGKLDELDLETLSKDERPNASIDIPLGVEFGITSKCKIYEVDENGSEENKKEIGEVVTKLGIDDGKTYFNLKISEDLMEKPAVLAALFRRF